MKKMTTLLSFFLLGLLVLSACQPAEAWQVLATPRAEFLTLLVGFNDTTFGISIGEDGLLFHTGDGGQTWLEADNQSMGLYGLEIVDGEVAFACGQGNQVRQTVDGGLTWQVMADFGAGFPNHCRFMSFSDARTGWAATPSMLGTTTDGARSWTQAGLPDGVSSVAAISQYAPGEGFVLDVSGSLYATLNDTASWTLVGQLPLDGITIEAKSYPLAAMRFQNARQGMVIVSALVDGAGVVTAFHTVDGGATWTRETALARYGALFLSRDGRYLTVLTPPTSLTVLEYRGE
ncbi:MAG: hypothetical protein JXB85_07810 [Anaerolineales bacterium]|nr:hypothetical protein [Anaerolineales bacterium]